MTDSIDEWYLNGEDASMGDGLDDEYVESQEPWDQAELD